MINKIIIASILVTSGLACAEKSYRTDNTQPSTTTQTTTQSYERTPANESTDMKDVDNTAMNKRDSESTTLTPVDQMEGSKADVELTRKIREALNDNESLSTSAQNVKIITLKGITTLRGPVNTQAEKRTIEQVAKAAGAKKVKNQLEVKAKTE